MTIDDLMAIVPEEQRADVKALLDGMNPLAKVTDADSAADFIASHDVLKRGRDKLVTAAIDSHKRKFEEEKLPELRKALRDEVAKELNPEETPDQKRLRELEQQLAERENREKRYQLKEKLRGKAKEIGFDEELAERLVGLQTEDHETELTTFADRFKASVNRMVEEEVNKRWPNKAPKANGSKAGVISEFQDIPEGITPEQYADMRSKGQIKYDGEDE